MLIYPYTLKAIFATGRSGYTYPMMYSVMMFKPGACSTTQFAKSTQSLSIYVYIKAKIGWEVYLVCGGRDDTNRKGENNRNGASEQYTPPRQLKSLLVMDASEEDERDVHH